MGEMAREAGTGPSNDMGRLAKRCQALGEGKGGAKASQNLRSIKEKRKGKEKGTIDVKLVA